MKRKRRRSRYGVEWLDGWRDSRRAAEKEEEKEGV
jgi:hypothetical protein